VEEEDRVVHDEAVLPDRQRTAGPMRRDRSSEGEFRGPRRVRSRCHGSDGPG
jgi:hypothetical protein